MNRPGPLAPLEAVRYQCCSFASARGSRRALLTRLLVVGVTATGDTIRRFSKTFALQPNAYVEQQGPDLVAKGAGSATLWIYAGTEMTRRFFADTTRAARVEIRVR